MSDTDAPDPPSIRCTVCGMRSYCPMDIQQRYCGNCHTYHPDYQEERAT